MSTLRDAITKLRVSQSELISHLDHELKIHQDWESQGNKTFHGNAVNQTIWSLRRELKQNGFSVQEMEQIEKFVLATWKPKSHANVKLPEIKKQRFIYPNRQLN